MNLEGAVRNWVNAHTLDCESCEKLLTDDELVSWASIENFVNAMFQCGWCWNRCYVEFELDMA